MKAKGANAFADRTYAGRRPKTETHGTMAFADRQGPQWLGRVAYGRPEHRLDIVPLHRGPCSFDVNDRRLHPACEADDRLRHRPHVVEGTQHIPGSLEAVVAPRELDRLAPHRSMSLWVVVLVIGETYEMQ
jgi:hypothetical protein